MPGLFSPAEPRPIEVILDALELFAERAGAVKKGVRVLSDALTSMSALGAPGMPGLFSPAEPRPIEGMPGFYSPAEPRPIEEVLSRMMTPGSMPGLSGLLQRQGQPLDLLVGQVGDLVTTLSAKDMTPVVLEADVGVDMTVEVQPPDLKAQIIFPQTALDIIADLVRTDPSPAKVSSTSTSTTRSRIRRP